MSFFDDNEDDIIYGRQHQRFDNGDREPRVPPTCNRCGKAGLNWQHDGERWVLHEGKYKVHQCDNSALIDDFEVVAP